MRDDMKVSKGLAFPVVALPGLVNMPAKGEDEQEAARVISVAATRATQWLEMGWVEMSGLGRGLRLHELSLDQEICTIDNFFQIPNGCPPISRNGTFTQHHHARQLRSVNLSSLLTISPQNFRRNDSRKKT